MLAVDASHTGNLLIRPHLDSAAPVRWRAAHPDRRKRFPERTRHTRELARTEVILPLVARVVLQMHLAVTNTRDRVLDVDAPSLALAHCPTGDLGPRLPNRTVVDEELCARYAVIVGLPRLRSCRQCVGQRGPVRLTACMGTPTGSDARGRGVRRPGLPVCDGPEIWRSTSRSRAGHTICAGARRKY